MSESLTVTQLMDWLEGRLSENEAGAIVSAVESDPSLTATVDWLRAFLDFGKSTVLIEPPAELTQESVSYFRASVRAQRPMGWLQMLVATLTSDSWQRASLVGVRHTALDAAPRQLVYEAATADIVLNTQMGRDRSRFNIIGQVFPTDGATPTSFTVQLIRQDREIGVIFANEVGKFAFSNVPAGVYTIVVRGDRAEITIPDVEFTS
jgi:hypothetical protein